MPSRQDIIFLFDDLWPLMKHSAIHRDKCLTQINTINFLFQRYGQNLDELLKELTALPDIGLVIASGLIFSANRSTMVPFDKYTIGWALQLKIIPDNKISANNYVNYSTKIVSYINNSSHLKTLIDFVREARNKVQFPIPPG